MGPFQELLTGGDPRDEVFRVGTGENGQENLGVDGFGKSKWVRFILSR